MIDVFILYFLIYVGAIAADVFIIVGIIYLLKRLFTPKAPQSITESKEEEKYRTE